MATSESHNDDCDGVYFKRDSCRIIFKIGDLLSENDIDVIVIPTPENGQRGSHSYPLYEALLSRGDQNLTEQIKKLSQKIRPGDKPQNIPNGKRSIILTPIPYYKNDKKAFELLKKTYTACLELAVRENYQSIAFPTIGCGQSGFEPEAAAVNLYQTLAQFDPPRDKKLNEIRIVIYDKGILNHFVDVFMRSSNEKNSRIKFEKMYGLVFSISLLLQCFDLHFRLFFYLFENHFILIRILEDRDIQIHLTYHWIEIEN